MDKAKETSNLCIHPSINDTENWTTNIKQLINEFMNQWNNISVSHWNKRSPNMSQNVHKRNHDDCSMLPKSSTASKHCARLKQLIKIMFDQPVIEHNIPQTRTKHDPTKTNQHGANQNTQTIFKNNNIRRHHDQLDFNWNKSYFCTISLQKQICPGTQRITLHHMK